MNRAEQFPPLFALTIGLIWHLLMQEFEGAHQQTYSGPLSSFDGIGGEPFAQAPCFVLGWGRDRILNRARKDQLRVLQNSLPTMHEERK